ncbi:MAG: Ig-like domain-containing protein [Hyphomicrobiaceae bacterium]
MSDGQGGTDTAVVTVTVTGVNDAPVVVDPATGLAGDPAAVVPAQSAADGETIAPLDVSGVFADADATDVLVFTASGLPAGLAIDPATGVISGTVDPSASLTGPHMVTVTATDPHGAFAEVGFVYAVSNPAPVAQDDALGASEDGPVTVGNVLADNGSGADHDTAPDSDALTVAAVNGDPALVGAGVAGSNGGVFTILGDGQVTFDPAGGFEDLAAGETRTTSIAYTVSDGQGGTDTAVVTVTVTGVNDAPVVVDPATGLAGDPAAVVPAQSAADGETIAPLDVSGVFADADATDVLVFTASGLPAGLAIDPATGVISGTVDPSASLTGPHMVTVTATDPHGAFAEVGFVYAVSNPAPVALDDALDASEDGGRRQQCSPTTAVPIVPPASEQR